MTCVLVVAIVGLPLLASALVATTANATRSLTPRRIALAATGLTALFTLALLPHAGDSTIAAVEWMPGAGAMGLTAGPSSLYAALATTGAAILVLLGTTSHRKELHPFAGAVVLLALGASNLAFFADHFLARYVALEVVALCVALAPLVEIENLARARLAWSSYLLLRVGSAGLLTAILVLNDATGTLHIGSALEAGTALDGPRLGWAVAGFALAAWVKLGGWPFHLWMQVGRSLSLPSQAWLYATLMPNLGAYLLYRVTPLLVLSGPLRTALLWLGASGAVLAAFVALTQSDTRAALAHIGAAQAGLALFVAAAGGKSLVWLGAIVLTPTRLLLYLATDTAQHANSTVRRRVAAGLFGLGGLAMAAFGWLSTWWVQEAGCPLVALVGAQIAVALIAVWVARAMRRLTSLGPEGIPNGMEKPSGSEFDWPRWITMGVLGGSVLVGSLAFEPLAGSLAAVSHLTPPTLPTFPALLHHAVNSPAVLAVAALGLVAWQLQRRSKDRAFTIVGMADRILTKETYDLEGGLRRAAQVLRAVVEVGIAERIATLVVQGVMSGARATWAVEYRGLEGLVIRTARVVVDGARFAHRVVEQEGLEGLLRRGVQAVLTLSRVLQRWHTGRLRRNLLWVPIVLVLAVLALVYRW
jgi:NADH:ubiquinone oxidoreductase subunit 5 (subunit L)/multisubunit Na+/H+ antiporter MnhA subunit